MKTITSRVHRRIDRSLGYLGLFLIGLIGWVYDRRAAAQARVSDMAAKASAGDIGV